LALSFTFLTIVDLIHIPPAPDRGYKNEASASRMKQMLHFCNMPINLIIFLFLFGFSAKQRMCFIFPGQRKAIQQIIMSYFNRLLIGWIRHSVCSREG